MHQLDQRMEHVAQQIVDSAFKVHCELGPGLLESAYETCLEYELKKRGFSVKRQLMLPIVYGDVELDAGYRIDLLVEDSVVLELKAVSKILPIHEAQLMTYMKLSGNELGFLINFNVTLIKQGIRRKILTTGEESSPLRR